MSGSTTKPGAVVAGRYRIEQLLGAGGFGEVLRATDMQSGRPIALKMLLPAMLTNDEGRARFRREAELACRLVHPNTVRVLDFGETEGSPFIAFELLEGRPLDAVLRAEGRLDVTRVAQIALQALGSLGEAHAIGIVHRDVKPSNLFLCDSAEQAEVTKIVDFGIAKKTVPAATALTQAGQTIGTPAYMAPEQVLGSNVGPATDLYALGLVMAEALGGRVVFQGDSGMAICMAHLADAPVPIPPDVLSSPLGAVIARATQKNVALRYPSAETMRSDVNAVLARLPAELRSSRPQPIRASSSLAFAPTGLGFAPTPIAASATAHGPIAPSSQSSALKVILAIVATIAAGALVVIAVVLVRGGADYSAQTPAHKTASHAGVRDHTDAFPGRHVSTIGTKAIRARIESAGFTVREERPVVGNMTWVVQGPGNEGGLVMYDLLQPGTLQPMLEALREQSGYCAHDAAALLFVSVNDDGASFALLDQITR